jgi:F-type H+-transporting ATPase subunit alpha
MEVLKQPQFSPYTIAEQYSILFVALNGYLMDIDPKRIQAFMKGFLDYLKDHHGKALETINQRGESSPEIETELSGAVEEYKAAAGSAGLAGTKTGKS